MSSQKLINPEVDYVIDSPEVFLSMDLAMPLGLMVSEMISNSLKHAFADQSTPRLSVKLKEVESGQYYLLLKDNGRGFPNDFDPEEGKGLGFEIINALVVQINADFNWKTSQGAELTIHFNEKSL